MKSIEIIENHFEVTFPTPFREFWETYLEKKVCVLKIFNHSDFYVLNELSIAELNTAKKSDINLSNELNGILSFIKKNPDLKDFVPIAADGLFTYIYSFIAFKKENGIVKNDTIYRIYLFLDCEPPIINVKKIASRFQDIFGVPEYVESLLYHNPNGNTLVFKSSDYVYAHLFEKYFFCESYLDYIAKQFNGLFENFNGINFFDDKGYILYCEFSGTRSVIFQFATEVMQSIAKTNTYVEPTEEMEKNILGFLSGKLGEYSLYRFNWTFFPNEIPSIGFGLSKDAALPETLDKYGMLFNNFK